MKYIGIIVMVLAHPVGYSIWNYLLWVPYIYPGYVNGNYPEGESAVLIGIGILEFFLVGLCLFIMGVLLENRQK